MEGNSKPLRFSRSRQKQEEQEWDKLSSEDGGSETSPIPEVFQMRKRREVITEKALSSEEYRPSEGSVAGSEGFKLGTIAGI